MAKNTPPPRPTIPIFGPLFHLLGGPARRVAPLVAILLALGGLGYWAWTQQQSHIENDPVYQVTLEKIVLTPSPEWIATDVKAEALRDASLDPPLSALDPLLAERVAKALAFHPWIASVTRVRKTAPGGLDCEVVYRRPVCMVELPPTEQGKRGLYAVDIEGILLPSRDFLDEPKRAARYPRLGGFAPSDVGRVGTRWPDARVVGGAKLAAILADSWLKLTLSKIVPTESSNATSAATYELLTDHGSRIVWGHAPGNEAEREAPAVKKIEALIRYVADHKSLEGRNGPQQLDVREAEVIVVAEQPSKRNLK